METNPETITAEDLIYLNHIRAVRDRLYIGVDHHSRQLTIAAAEGSALLRATEQGRGLAWVDVRVFDQDAFGYLALLEHLATAFPGVGRERYFFVGEPSYAKPFSAFLLNLGFAPSQVRSVDTREVGHYRKAHRFGAAGKNDHDDARALLAMGFRSLHDPASCLPLREASLAQHDREGLSELAEEHARLSGQLAELKNKIFHRVLAVLPELHRVWGQTRKGRKPDGETYERVRAALFEGKTPMKVLHAFPSAQAIRDAGFETVWRQVGGRGVPKKTIQELIRVAGPSAGIVHRERQLQLWIEELWDLERRLGAYEAAMEAVFQADPVLASLRDIKLLPVQNLAAIVGALGDLSRFRDVDQAKRALNVAPTALPQSGAVDDKGRPVQIWRLPANSYVWKNGQKRLAYESPGRKDVRRAGYLWFEMLMICQARYPDDPFVRLYRALKETHQAKARWVGKVRWKVIAKLVETIYYCLKHNRCYDAAKVVIQPAKKAS